MKSKRLALLCAVTAMTVAGGAMANEIYKWTDENGTVHYGDRPSGAATEERLALTFTRTDNAAVQQRVQARVEATAAREEARTAAAQAQEKAAEKEAEAAERAERCDKARARLERYLQSQRLYRMDENGERVYLDDTQLENERQKAEEQITEYCS